MAQHFPDDEALRAVVKALSADAVLRESYVLKGGNALALAYGGPRRSVDVDLSAVEPSPEQPDSASQEVLARFTRRLDRALEREVARSKYARMVVQSGHIYPGGKDPRTFPALEVKVGYTKREDRPPPYSDVVKLEISLNEVVCDAEYARLDEANIHVSSLNDIVAEKLRALLQQVERKRSRPGDVYDVWFYATNAAALLDTAKITDFLLRKSEGRLGPVTKASFEEPEVKARAREGYEAIADRLPPESELPPFEKAFSTVQELVGRLGLPEGR